MKQKQLPPPYPGVKSHHPACLPSISSFSVPCLYPLDQNSLYAHPLHSACLQHHSPKACSAALGTKGILSPQVFHYCLYFFSADRDAHELANNLYLLRREIQFFLRRKIIWYFTSPWSSPNRKMFSVSSQWLIFLNGFQPLACLF